MCGKFGRPLVGAEYHFSMMRLECKDGAHFKFWEADVKGASLTVHLVASAPQGR